MGSSSSKPAASQPHEWKAPGPIGVSQDVVESLQSNRETDTSRAQTLELAVQARLAEALKALDGKESAALAEARQRASELIEHEEVRGTDGPAVSKEVAALRARLEGRKQLRELPEGVERARGSVVACLREHDRRPLDCWQQVQAFKDEVRRLEKSWVDRTVQ